MKEGKDANEDFTTGDYAGGSIIGVGNGFLTSYSSEGSVGGMPTVSVSAEAQNMNFVNLPYTAGVSSPGAGIGLKTGTNTAGALRSVLQISGANPAVNPTDGSKTTVTFSLEGLVAPSILVASSTASLTTRSRSNASGRRAASPA